jgi:hypothetical protein
MNITDMKRYKSREWNFALDIPKRWNSLPPVPTNSPYEVIRFASREEGIHALIIFREPSDPKRTVNERADKVQKLLGSKGFSYFARTETMIQSRPVLMLDFDRPHDEESLPLILDGDRYVQRPDLVWSCRHYFLAADTLAYTLGFGTTNKAAMLDLFDRMAKTFEIIPE